MPLSRGSLRIRPPLHRRSVAAGSAVIEDAIGLRHWTVERTPTTGGESGGFNPADDLTPYNTGGAKRGGAIKTGKKKR